MEMTYKIPADIKEKIPDYFYLALGGELVSIFGHDVFQKDEDSVCTLDYLTGTAGWVAAFRMTCKKLNMFWLPVYYDGLEWFESDLFDDEVCQGVIDAFLKNNSNQNTYYLYLLGVT